MSIDSEGGRVVWFYARATLNGSTRIFCTIMCEIKIFLRFISKNRNCRHIIIINYTIITTTQLFNTSFIDTVNDSISDRSNSERVLEQWCPFGLLYISIINCYVYPWAAGFTGVCVLDTSKTRLARNNNALLWLYHDDPTIIIFKYACV